MKNNREVWKDVVGYEGLYEVSDLGRIKSFKYGKEKIMRNRINNGGYVELTLYKNKKVSPKSLHRLIAIAFLENPDNFPVVNHKDGDKLNNNVNNLEWCTYSHNNKHAYDMGMNKVKPLLQIHSDTGEIIKEWNSMKEASLALNIHSGNIRKCINGENRHAGGFKWKDKVN